MTPIFRRSAPLAVWMLACLIPPAHAQEAAPAPDSQWMLRGGLDVGRDHSRGVQVSVDYTGRTNVTPLDDRYWDVGGAFSRSQATVKSTAMRAGAETRTGTGNGYASYGTQRWRGVLGFEATKDEALRKSQRWSGGVDFAHGGFGANLTLSHRRTVFEDFTPSAQAAEDLGVTLPGAVTANCSLIDKGLGGRLGYRGSAWSAYATGSSFHYDKVKCGFDAALPDVLQRLSTADFFGFADGFLDRARARVAGRIGQQSRLLKSEFGLGASVTWGIDWALDYLRSTDEFGGAKLSNYALTGTLGLAPNVSLDLTLGSTSGDLGSAPYLGVMLAVAM